jgi:hypothetical protein
MPMALEEGQRPIDIYPNNFLQRNNVGLYARYSGDFDRAVRESEQTLKMNPPSRRRTCAWRLRNWEKAK